jgi:endonuclease I
MPAGYYDKADNKSDAELKAWLRECIRPHDSIPYGSGIGKTWEVFYYADRNEEGYCEDMYCDTWVKITTPGAVASGCNIEHSFAKSWWGGKKHAPYLDCYHLNPSNSTANSERSNYPLGYATNLVKTAGSLKIGTMHHEVLNEDFKVFEPKDEYKGDFARAYFYMATCYGHDLNGKVPDLPVYDKKKNGWMAY